MNADLFDALSRRIARAADRPGTRRRFLRALGAGVGAATLSKSGMSVAAGLQDATPAAAAPEASAEVADLAFELRYDVDRIFAFVRDEVVYDPYPGVLRGALGTLWGRAGNSADQALLLAELLKASLIPSRLVVAELPDDAAAALLATGDLDSGRLRGRADRLLTARVGPATDTDPPPVATEAFAAEFSAFAERIVATLDRHMDDGIATVTDALAGAGIALPTPSVALPEEERRRHIWVQYASGPDWIDLDPTLPGAAPGDAVVTGATPIGALPPELEHRVAIRVVAEQVQGGAVVRNELLAYETPSSRLVGVSVSLMHPEPDVLESIGVAVGGLLEGFRSFLPTLLVGEESIFGMPVTFGTGGGVLDTFGGETVDGDTLAEWLEVTVSTPDGTTTATRTLFDRVGEEARAAGSIDPATVQPVQFDGGADGGFLPLAGLWSFAVVTGTLPGGIDAPAIPEDFKVDDILPALHAYHVATEVGALRLPVLDGVRLFRDEPNVTAFLIRPSDDQNAQGTSGIGIDILHQGVGVAPGPTASEVHPLLAAGVLAHAVEQTLFEAGGQAPLDMPITATSGVLRVFDAARAASVATLVLTPDDAAVVPLELAAEPRKRVQEILASGRIVIIPERAVELAGRKRIGWWVVDPTTGSVWDQMDDGGGSVLTEEGYILVRDFVCGFALFWTGAYLLAAIVVATQTTDVVVNAFPAGAAIGGAGVSAEICAA